MPEVPGQAPLAAAPPADVLWPAKCSRSGAGRPFLPTTIPSWRTPPRSLAPVEGRLRQRESGGPGPLCGTHAASRRAAYPPRPQLPAISHLGLLRAPAAPEPGAELPRSGPRREPGAARRRGPGPSGRRSSMEPSRWTTCGRAPGPMWQTRAGSRSDFQGAEEAFDFAFSFLRLGTGEPMEKALLLDLKASLLTKQRRFPKALGLLRRAMVIFLELGETHRAGRALVKMSIGPLHRPASPKRRSPLLYRALNLIDPAREPRLLLIAWHNLIDDLTETGQFMEAQKLLVKARPLYQRFPQPWFRNPRKWTRRQDRTRPRPGRPGRDPLPCGA